MDHVVALIGMGLLSWWLSWGLVLTMTVLNIMMVVLFKISWSFLNSSDNCNNINHGSMGESLLPTQLKLNTNIQHDTPLTPICGDNKRRWFIASFASASLYQSCWASIASKLLILAPENKTITRRWLHWIYVHRIYLRSTFIELPSVHTLKV